MKPIKLASNLTIQASAVTDTWAWFGTRGTGKTYAAGATVEAFVDGGAQVVVVDPVGVWYGLRLAADGHGRGLDIPVFGGLHADVPLEPTGGELVAQLVVETGISVVLDVSMMTLGQQHRFALAFTTALFNLKKSKRTPIFVLFDEAHEFIPQQPGPQEAEMLGAVRRLWKMGRNFGIGVGLISQRPAEVNKGVMNLTERMFCGKFKGPHDRKAMEGWAKDNEADLSVLDEIPRLPPGELMHWTDAGPERVRFFPKKTFDASKTPEQGDVKPSASLPRIDLAAVRTAMAATIEEAKANDPRALRARIAELERAAQIQPKAAPAKPAAPQKTRDVPVFSDVDLKRIEKASEKFGGAHAHAAGILAKVVEHLEKSKAGFDGTIGRLVLSATKAIAPPDAPPRPLYAERTNGVAPTRIVRAPAPRSASPTTGAAGEFSRCARALLVVLAQRGHATDSQLAALSGYRVTSSTFANGLSELRTGGLMDQGPPERRGVTQEGRDVIGPTPPLPTGRALLDHWVARLTACEGKMLTAIFEHGTLTREQLSEETGYRQTSSTFANGISGIRMLELVHGPNAGDLTIADVFRE